MGGGGKEDDHNCFLLYIRTSRGVSLKMISTAVSDPLLGLYIKLVSQEEGIPFIDVYVLIRKY